MLSCAKHARRGLTLMELVIVMVVLIGLAGMVVPMLPSMVTRAHTSSHATNVGEIIKLVETFSALNNSYPDNLDNLVATGGGSGALNPNLPGAGTAGVLTQPTAGWTTPCGGEVIAGVLTAPQIAALNAVGLTTVWPVDATTGGTQDLVNAPYGAAAAGAAIGADTAVLSGTAAQRLYNEPTSSSATYAVFGFGSKASIVGHGVPEAPVHFSDEPGDLSNASLTYARYGLVFRVTDTAGRTLNRAQFVGALAFHADEVSGAAAAVAEYSAIGR